MIKEKVWNPRRAFRELVASDHLIVAPGSFGPMPAKLIERNGFEAVYMTGSGTAIARLGLPDVGLLTMTEMVANAEAIADSVRIPVIADADTGYGNAINVRRTVREYEKVGIAAIHVEDQVTPKKCGHFEGKQVIPIKEMEGKVLAACDARYDDDFMIIVRCDALAVEGMDGVRCRCEAYVDAGAEMLFVEAPKTVEELKELPSYFDVPLLLNVSTSGKTPYFSASEYEAMGFKVAIYPNFATMAAIKAMDELFATLHEHGDVREILDLCSSYAARADLSGLGEIQELEARYGFPEETRTSI